MNREVWEHIVQEARNGNETLFNKAVSTTIYNHFYDLIIKKVRDENLTQEIYNLTMYKFWERFILKQEKLPKSNIEGYVYQMSRNAFYEIKREQHRRRNFNSVSIKSQELVEKFKDAHNDNLELNAKLQDQMNLKLFQIVQSLDETCQKIINLNIIDGQSLVKLKEEVAVNGSYNAIVQKKKRCIKAMYRRLYAAIQEKKYILPETL